MSIMTPDILAETEHKGIEIKRQARGSNLEEARALGLVPGRTSSNKQVREPEGVFLLAAGRCLYIHVGRRSVWIRISVMLKLVGTVVAS